MPVLICGCSLEGLSVAWDTSSSSTGGGEGGYPRIRIEAEDDPPCELSGRFERVEDPLASGGQYVAVPDVGCNNDRVDCVFQVSEAGTYRIRARVAEGPAKGVDNSFWISVDDKPEPAIRYDFTGADFHEDYVSDEKDETGTPLKFALDPGAHVVTFGCREDGSKLDWVELVRIGP
ncbi:hypothetical protein BE21_00735 [Sorangium cellulosum]|uniref:CBM6 domain-containing protein n=1 Tax=Sorangium cellulosum TaxID=56 RepID=A0A150U3H6_SORCE|nr:hypothetical protein BE21_00735 [Sorangium cellulosum]